jgi:hypothetical protein
MIVDGPKGIRCRQGSGRMRLAKDLGSREETDELTPCGDAARD